MSRETITMTEALERYVDDVSPPEHPALTALRAETLALGGLAIMQISRTQGHFMSLLTRLIGAKRHIEIGTFTGYSAAVVAMAMPPDGVVVACDINEDWAAIAKRAWSACGISAKIDLRIAPGVETLDRFIADGAVFDSMFIDADKVGYDAYYERGLQLLRPGGVILVDNVLWHGSVVDAADTTESAVAIRALNAKLAKDQRVDVSMVPVGDGLTIARKR
ncbi:MAG: class I SAM-dependent methyltransferase [Deltaproteobacteria bacterium]|nr:class I SAM-dependent methyltransferase [Deltaproteobacteria bacterium]